MSMKRVVVTVLVSLALPIGADAQAVSTVRVVRAAAVLEQPVGDARSVGTVAIGELLDVLDERNGWYLVRPPQGGPARGWRTAWVNSMTVEAMDRVAAGVAAPVPQVAPPLAAPETARRKGFIIGAGVGGGLHRTPSSRFIGATNNFAIGTNFTVGYAPTDRAFLYYSNKASFTTNEDYDALGVTGFGVTYLFRRTAPTGYVTGSIGGGFGASLYQTTTAETGLGWSAGAGWEFKRHLSLEGDVLSVQLGNGQTHTVYRGLFLFTFY